MHNSLSRLSIFALTAATALGLSACAEPNMFPDGYTYHGAVYKSATPPESPKFTKAERKSMGPNQAEQFRQSVYKLVESLTTRAGMPPKAVFVKQPDKMSSFHANIDNDLRESLRHMNYRLADTPADAYVFTWTATTIKDADGKAIAGAPGVPNVHLALQVFDGTGETAKMLTEEAGDFYIQGADQIDVPSSIFSDVPMPDMTPSTASGPNN